MTISAVALDDKEIVTPAIEVAAGDLTVEQAYKQYSGLPCGCPHCLGDSLEEGNIGFSDGQLIDPLTEVVNREDFQEFIKFTSEHGINAAMVQATNNPESVFAKLVQRYGNRDIVTNLNSLLKGPYPIASLQTDKRFTVNYRRESKSSNGDIRKFMHFAHAQGIRRLHGCHDPIQIDHHVACEVLKRDLEKYYYRSPQYFLKREFSFVTSSNNSYVADVAVLSSSGALVKVYEVQRTSRSLKELQKKTQDISQDCEIEWVLFAGAYRQMGEQRSWLSSVGIPYSKLLFDNYRIVIEPGSPPKFSAESSNSQSRKYPDKSTCLHQEDFTENEPFESLLPSQIAKTDFRSNNLPVNQSSSSNLNTFLSENSDTLNKNYFQDTGENPSQAKQYILVEGNSPTNHFYLDDYEKFITGRDVLGSEGKGMVTAVDFIFRKALIRRGEKTNWVPFESLYIYE